MNLKEKLRIIIWNNGDIHSSLELEIRREGNERV